MSKTYLYFYLFIYSINIFYCFTVDNVIKYGKYGVIGIGSVAVIATVVIAGPIAIDGAASIVASAEAMIGRF